ncbi:MAG: sigma-70 family RNA polymerase sigma factor [Planctomycetota bacterium]
MMTRDSTRLAAARAHGELPYSVLDRILEQQRALDRDLNRVLDDCGQLPLFDDLLAESILGSRENCLDGSGLAFSRAFTSRAQQLGADEEIRLAKRIEFSRRRLERSIVTARVPREIKEEYFNLIETPELARVDLAPPDPKAPGEATLEARWSEYLRLRNDLIEANIPLVERIAARYRTYGIPRSDLVQHGDIGLIRAATKFDWRRNVRFRTYAEWWIRQAIERATDTDRDIVHVPRPMRQRLSKAKRLNRASGRDIPLDTARFAELTDLDRATAARIFSIKAGVASLDQTGPDQSRTLGSDLVGPDLARRTERDDEEFLRCRLNRMLGQLPEREQHVISLRYGLDGRSPHTLEEVGRILDISRERVRQLQLRAIDQMRNAAADPRLTTDC